MTYTGQAEDWTGGSLSRMTEISMRTGAKISMSHDLHRSSERLGRGRDEHRDGDLHEHQDEDFGEQ